MPRSKAMNVEKLGSTDFYASPDFVPERCAGAALSSRFGVWAVVVAGAALVLVFEVIAVLAATGGHLVYALEAPYTELALAEQIIHGHYGLVPGEAAAPSSSILFPFLLAPFVALGIGTVAAAIINLLAALATALAALFLAEECGVRLSEIPRLRLFILAVAVTLALDLAGLAMTGLEHSLHVALTLVYLLGLVRFVRRGRCDWWWFACIIIQPVLRFEAAGMLVADVLIFLGFRRYRYALVTILIGMALVGGYCLFLYGLGLPLLPSSVLARSDWSNAAVGTHGGIIDVLVQLVRNFRDNLQSFGAAQVLLGVALALPWLTRLPAPRLWSEVSHADWTKVMTIFFMSFVSLAQLVGGKVGTVPPRYEAYVLALDLFGLGVVYRDEVARWCRQASWTRVALFSIALLLVFSGYAVQTFMMPILARKEYLGPVQVHRFVTEFYRKPVAVDQLGYINVNNPFYVLDLSGLASETARLARDRGAPVTWMDASLAAHHISLAIIDSGADPRVPADWIRLGALRLTSGDDASNHLVFYARRPEAVKEILPALQRFAATLPAGIRLVQPEGLAMRTASRR